jgi:hypothetical protein
MIAHFMNFFSVKEGSVPGHPSNCQSGWITHDSKVNHEIRKAILQLSIKIASSGICQLSNQLCGKRSRIITSIRIKRAIRVKAAIHFKEDISSYREVSFTS